MKKIGVLLLCCLLLTGMPDHAVSNDQDICLSEEEKKLFDLIMSYRKSLKLKPIPWSARLTVVAQAHARDLDTYFDSENVEECNPHSWSDKGNWSACCFGSDHKQDSCMWNKPREIAGYEGDGYEIAYISAREATAYEAITGWKKSPGHNPLIINSGSWKELTWKGIGIGIYGQYGVVWFGEVKDPSTLKICR